MDEAIGLAAGYNFFVFEAILVSFLDAANAHEKYGLI
jgi:hypothetical protein